jgi:hypothetical protein
MVVVEKALDGGAEERMSELAGVWCITTTHTAILSDIPPLHAIHYNPMGAPSFL